MNPSAHVTSLAALNAFRADIVEFVDTAKDAISTLNLDIQKMLEWLDQQAQVWKAEVRKAEDAVILAKNELARKKMMRIGDRAPDTTDQEKALKLAKLRLEHAQERQANTKRWQRNLPDEVKEYEGPSRHLQASVEVDLPRANAILERMVIALEQYTRPGKS